MRGSRPRVLLPPSTARASPPGGRHKGRYGDPPGHSQVDLRVKARKGRGYRCVSLGPSVHLVGGAIPGFPSRLSPPPRVLRAPLRPPDTHSWTPPLLSQLSPLCGLPCRPGTQAQLSGARLLGPCTRQTRELCVRSGPPCSVCRARTQRAAVANKTFFSGCSGMLVCGTGDWFSPLSAGPQRPRPSPPEWPGHPPGGQCMEAQPSSPRLPRSVQGARHSMKPVLLTPPPCPKPTRFLS